jgi:hypothetical protein
MQGDCGGMTFRDDGRGNFYYFEVCRNAPYEVSKFADASGDNVTDLSESSSSAIHSGLSQQNKIAIVAVGSTMIFYANEQKINQVQDSSYTSGNIALIAYPEDGNVTDVAYSNARLWTL